ncbi:MAG: dTDP-glucose 4,6-dehydratase, partial [Candidatus Zixiibacteriota bacterium]
FIGSNFLLMMVPRYPEYYFVNIDCLTYAGNLSNLETIAQSPNYIFEKVDITDFSILEKCFAAHQIDSVVHLAAESHVDRSIVGPAKFIRTNIAGTFYLLELARKLAEKNSSFRFLHVSTDEVYGSAKAGEKFSEESLYRPNSPYAASKAAADHLVRSYLCTYGIDVVITNCTNNYGPFQFPEKLIPLVVNNAINNKPIPVYGDGKNERDWLYVSDHCEALDLVFHKGVTGESYNISAENVIHNIDLVKSICKILDKMLGGEPCENLIQFVTDRPGHDRRYALDSTKIRKELGWKPSHQFEKALETTVEWYVENKQWLNRCTSGEYLKYYDSMYANR